MSSINFKLNWAMTPLSNIFIEEYMNMPNYPVYSLVYIYALKKAVGGESISNEQIAEHFQIMESEVAKIWHYWENAGLLKQGEAEDGISLEFLTPNSKLIRPDLQKIVEQPKLKRENKPVYDPAEINRIRNQDTNIAELLSSAENLLKKPLSANDISTIVSFYDWLGLPIEVIYVLLCYCGNNGKGTRYMEKVAIDWADKGINDQEAAEDYLNLYVGQYRKIMRYYGITDRNPAENEQNYMSSWLRKLNMPLDLIKEACSRTIQNTGKASFAYTNKILNDWHNAGIESMGQVKQLDKEYTKKAEEKKAAKKQQTPAKNGTFNNYEQRSYDDAMLDSFINSGLDDF